MFISLPTKRRPAEAALSSPPDRASRWRWPLPPPLRFAAFSLAAVALAAAAAVATLEETKREIGPLPLEAAEATSVTVLDRETRLLRAFTTKDGRWRLPLDVSEVD